MSLAYLQSVSSAITAHPVTLHKERIYAYPTYNTTEVSRETLEFITPGHSYIILKSSDELGCAQPAS